MDFSSYIDSLDDGGGLDYYDSDNLESNSEIPSPPIDHDQTHKTETEQVANETEHKNADTPGDSYEKGGEKKHQSKENDSIVDPILFGINGIGKIDHQELAIGNIEIPIFPYSWSLEQMVGEEATNDSLISLAKGLLEYVSETVNHRYPDHMSRVAILFFACDLGGTILKQALLMALENHRYSFIVENTKYLLFFGTPHRVLAPYHWGTLMSRMILAYCHGRASPHYTLILDRLTTIHNDVYEDFNNLLDQYHIAIVDYFQDPSGDYETLVDRFSATLDREEEIQIGISTSWTSMLYLPEHVSLIREKFVDARTVMRWCYEPIPRYLGIRVDSWVSLFVNSTRRDQIKS